MRFIYIGLDDIEQARSRVDDVETINETGFITLFRAVRKTHAILVAVCTTQDGTWDTFTTEN